MKTTCEVDGTIYFTQKSRIPVNNITEEYNPKKAHVHQYN